MNETFPVQFRHVGVDQGGRAFSFIGFFYENRAAAETAVLALQEYATASGPKTSRLAAISTPHSVLLTFTCRWTDAGGKEREFDVAISGVELREFEKVLASIRLFVCYGILVGWEDDKGVPQVYPPAEFALFRSELELDGDTIRATGTLPPPNIRGR